MADKTTETTETTTAPWTAEDFDAARAWRLVENTRAERDAARRELADLKAAADTASTDRETLAADLAAAHRELYVERALRKHPALESVRDLLTGDDEGAVLATADRLATLTGPSSTPAPADSAATADDLERRPKPALRPGHGADDGPEFDPHKIAAKVRGAK